MVNYSLPPVAIALGRRALAVALESLRGRVSRGVTAMAASEFVQMTVAEAAAAIDAATLTMHARPRRGRSNWSQMASRSRRNSSCAPAAT